MKNIGLSAFLISVISLVGCGGDDSDNLPMMTGAVAISCADLYNDGTTSGCRPTTASIFYKALGVLGLRSANAAIKIVEAGVISRGTTIVAELNIENTTPDVFSGYYESVFDAGCNGEAEWRLNPKQPIQVEANSTLNSANGGQCGDMPLGTHNLTAVLYGPDSQEVIDQVIVTFTLVE